MENTRLALCDVGGPFKDLIEKLSGDDGGQWLRALNKMLRKENSWEVFPVRKTIKLGTHKSIDSLCGAIKGNGCRISDWANDILNKVTVSSIETKVDLVVISVAELGFKDGATRAYIYEKAKRLGLELCPAEVGPQLRLQYKDQPREEWLLIAMKPIPDFRGDLRVFGVEHGLGGLWLDASFGYSDRFWSGDYRWVFLRRK